MQNDRRASVAPLIIAISEQIAEKESEINHLLEEMLSVSGAIGSEPFVFGGYIISPVENGTPTLIRIPQTIVSTGGSRVGGYESYPSHPDAHAQYVAQEQERFRSGESVRVPIERRPLPDMTRQGRANTFEAASAGPKVGDRVEGRLMPALGKKGIIVSVNPDGTFDIQYEGMAGKERAYPNGFAII